MTPLSDALTAAQRRALQVLEKAYVAGSLEAPQFVLALNQMGCGDEIDQGHLMAALNELKAWGAPVPAETNGAPKKDDPVTAPQLQLIGKLCREKKLEHPDYAGLTKAQASEIISALQDGIYDPAKWKVPF